MGRGVIRRFTASQLWSAAFLIMTSCSNLSDNRSNAPAVPRLDAERQITQGPGGRIISNTGIWSPDSRWIVYDTRPDDAGSVFGGQTIEMSNVLTGEVRELYRSQNDACCGVVTFHPHDWRVVFILGPEHPTADWQYCAWHRQGVVVEVSQPGVKANLDARDITPPFTPGALRGGSHVHVWDSAGRWVSFTYEDHVLAQFKSATPANDINQRNIGVSIPGHAVRVNHASPRNHDGDYFSVLVTHTTAEPQPGSDEISRAYEEAWVGTNGYVRRDGSRQNHALAFQGQVLSGKGATLSEVFIADLPDDLTIAGDGPLCGTETRAPYPPRGTVQRRLTYTAERRFPGIQGPRHWLRSSPDGTRIAFLMKDDAGVVQLWTVSPNGGELRQVTRNHGSVASAFTWSPDGRDIAHVMDNSVCVTEVVSGKTKRLTSPTDDACSPRPEACVFSPDGKKIAFVRRLPSPQLPANQICVVRVQE
jgi:dipeptidyl aminopeptidase/acylaminoacyl peptidase